MRFKVHGGTVAHGQSSLCTTCAHSIITRGQKLEDEIVDCRVFGIGHRRVTFKVTSCSAYHDERLPSLVQLMEEAWVFQPGSKKQRAGFVRGSELRREEMAAVMAELDEMDREKR
jgi:hypothetical protein